MWIKNVNNLTYFAWQIQTNTPLDSRRQKNKQTQNCVQNPQTEDRTKNSSDLLEFKTATLTPARKLKVSVWAPDPTITVTFNFLCGQEGGLYAVLTGPVMSRVLAGRCQPDISPQAQEGKPPFPGSSRFSPGQHFHFWFHLPFVGKWTWMLSLCPACPSGNKVQDHLGR